MKLFVIAALAVLCLRADDPLISQASNNGSGQLQYNCEAKVTVGQTKVKLSDSTLTNIVVLTNVGTVTTVSAHGLWPGAVVTVSGSSTSALNGTYSVVTVPSSTTYTITTAGVANATYTTGLEIATNSPRLNDPVWRITVIHYTSGAYDGSYLGGGSVSFNFKARCTDKTTY